MADGNKLAPFSPEWVHEVVQYHAPDEDGIARIHAIRVATEFLLTAIIKTCPNCADRSAAIRHAREAMMNANASIALRGLV